MSSYRINPFSVNTYFICSCSQKIEWTVPAIKLQFQVAIGNVMSFFLSFFLGKRDENFPLLKFTRDAKSRTKLFCFRQQTERYERRSEVKSFEEEKYYLDLSLSHPKNWASNWSIIFLFLCFKNKYVQNETQRYHIFGAFSLKLSPRVVFENENKIKMKVMQLPGYSLPVCLIVGDFLD